MRNSSLFGEEAPNWRGGRSITHDGYVQIYAPEHPRAHQNHILEHVLVAESAMNRFMPEGAAVYHFDKNPANNDHRNLVICQSNGYRSLLDKRLRAYKACGHADWHWCRFCGTWSPKSEITFHGRSETYHQACQAAARRKARG